MKDIKKLVKIVLPFRFKILLGLALESISIVFELFSYTMLIPFLRVLFNPDKLVLERPEFAFNLASLQNNLFYFLSQIIIEKGALAALFFVSLIVLCASFLKNLFLYSSRYVFAPVMNGITRNYQTKIYNKLIFMPLAYFSDERKGDLITRMTSDVQIIRQTVSHLISFLLTKPVALIMFLGYLFYMNFSLTIIVLVLLPFMGLIITRLSRNLRTKSYNSQVLQSSQMNLFEESISGLRVIKSFNAENKLIDKFSDLTNRIFRLNNKIDRRVGLATPLSEFLGTIIVIAILYFGAFSILRGHSSMSSEAFIAYLVVFSQIISPAKEFVNSYYSIQKGMASVKRIEEIMQAEDTIVEDPNPLPIKDFEQSIIFKNVNFSYEDGKNVLQDINIEIKKGETIAIVGESGAGKSTLVDLLPRFYDYTSGEITIDGKPLKKLVIDDLRNLFGIVSQNSILFNDTIRNNITFGVDKYSEEDIVNAAKIANAYDFINEKPNGFDTEIGEDGSKLSGGQRQRISIARAILKNPPILILDEATSSLDTESEKLVQQALDTIMKDKTSIIIAHRLSTVKNADRIYVMSNGKIVEQGKHNELIEKGGIYKKLVDLQMI